MDRPEPTEVTGIRDRLAALRDRSRISATPHLLGLLAHAAALAVCLAAARAGSTALAVACWPAIAWLHHAQLARLHEAVHGLLLPSRRGNELLGIAIGTASLTPMSVYRDVHARHHAHLGDPDDPEFWPYNRPSASRARRLCYAAAELLLGFLVTPALYSLRTARAAGRLAPRVRQRLVLEWVLLGLFLTTLLAATAWSGWWQEFFLVAVGPAWLLGLIQTLRKFTEHLGLAGDSIYACTRTVRYRGWLGRMLSATQLHVEHHGTHHRWPAIPYHNLPAATDLLAEHQATPLYPNHAVALLEALRHLADPRVGRQWRAAGHGAGMTSAGRTDAGGTKARRTAGGAAARD